MSDPVLSGYLVAESLIDLLTCIVILANICVLAGNVYLQWSE